MSAEMDALVKSATDRLESLEEALDGLQKIRAVYTSDDGKVEASVDGNGALVGLWLAESITQTPAAEVGPLITAACHRAAAQAGEERAKVIGKLNTAFAPAESPGPE